MGDLTFSVRVTITIPGSVIAEVLGIAPAHLLDALKSVLPNLNVAGAAPDDAAPLTQAEAAALLQVSKGTLINWAREGIVRPIKRGRRIYYNKAELLKAATSTH